MTKLSDSQYHNRTNTNLSCCDDATHDASCSNCCKLFIVEPLALALGVPICKDDITNATLLHIHPVTANRYVHSTLVLLILKCVLIEIENTYTAELTNMLERDL